MTRSNRLDISSPWIWAGLALLTVSIRVWGIQIHSLDFDERFSLYLSQLPLGTLLGKAAAQGPDPHPPVYFLMLRGWVSLFGTSALALRGLSVVGGVTLVLLVAAWTSDLTSPRTGLLAGVLAATSPYLVWYSQEARMYMWVAALGLGSTWALMRAVRSGRQLWWAAYLLLGLATLYTHVVGAVALVVHLTFLLLGGPFDRRRRIVGLLGTTLLALAYAPYAYPVWAQAIGEPAARIYPRPDLLSAIGQFLVATAAHMARLPTGGGALLAAAGALLAAAGAWSLLRSRRSPVRGSPFGSTGLLGVPGGEGGIQRLAAIAFYLILPAVMIAALWLARPLYHVKFLVLISPHLFLVWAAGIRTIWREVRPLAPVTGALLLALNLYGLAHNGSAAMAREDWRTAGTYLIQHAGVRDAILVHLEHYHLPLEHYYSGPAPVTHPFGAEIPSLEAIEEILSGYQRYETVWLALSGEHLGDPGGIVEGWFRTRYPLITEIFPARIRVQGYAVRYRLPSLPVEAESLDAKVGAGLRLQGYRVDETVFPATSTLLHPPSHWVHVTLFWEAAGLGSSAQVRVEMVDSLGQVWGGNLPQTEGLRSVFPLERWAPGEILRDDYDVNVNPQTPPGEYWIIVRVSDPTTGEPLLLEQDGGEVQAIVLTTVQVVR